ncbi:MAG: ABC transporter substrate-binding protein [Deltaproteobacteria bacterium]|nr:ABC transporter substrate-binding protein [Deltaproteobacteria bacterium]
MRGFLVPILLLLTFAGCSSNSIPNDTLVVGIESNPTQLDPRLATDAYSVRISHLLFDGLLRFNEKGEAIPWIAKNWLNPDPLTYIFTLRSSISFHDGTPLTASDVVYTFESMKDPQLRSPNLATLEALDSVTATHANTVVFRLKEPYIPFLHLLDIGIVPQRQVEQDPQGFRKNPIGTGPFQLDAWKVDDALVLTANLHHFLISPHLKKVIFKIIPNDTTRLLELRKGSVEFVQNAVSPDLLPFLSRSKRLEIIETEGTSYSYLGMNLQDSVLKNLQVRQAMAYALNREEIVQYLLENKAELAAGPLAPPIFGHTDSVEKFFHDPEKAKALLDEAGYEDPDGEGPLPRFSLSYKTTDNPLRKRIAEVLKLQLASVGIELQVRTYEWGTFFSDIQKGNFQLFTLTWVGISEPDILYYLFHSKSAPPQGANRGHYQNVEVDALLEEGRRTLDPEERKKIYREVQKILAEDLPYISLWYPHTLIVMDKRIRGFIPYPNGAFDSFIQVHKETAL